MTSFGIERAVAVRVQSDVDARAALRAVRARGFGGDVDRAARTGGARLALRPGRSGRAGRPLRSRGSVGTGGTRRSRRSCRPLRPGVTLGAGGTLRARRTCFRQRDLRPLAADARPERLRDAGVRDRARQEIGARNGNPRTEVALPQARWRGHEGHVSGQRGRARRERRRRRRGQRDGVRGRRGGIRRGIRSASSGASRHSDAQPTGGEGSERDLPSFHPLFSFSGSSRAAAKRCASRASGALDGLAFMRNPLNANENCDQRNHDEWRLRGTCGLSGARGDGPRVSAWCAARRRETRSRRHRCNRHRRRRGAQGDVRLPRASAPDAHVGAVTRLDAWNFRTASFVVRGDALTSA